MQGIIVSLAIKYILGQIETYGQAVDWQKVKIQFSAWITALSWPSFISKEITLVGDALIDDAAKALQDSADMQTIVSSLAGKDFSGAEAALKKLIAGVAGANPYVSALLAAA